MRHFPPPQASGAPGRRIAVIGSGISGLSAAWLLSQRHDVTIYEREERLGGHAHTVEIETATGPVAVDTGFIVYNEANYPNFTALLRHLGAGSERSDMSFAASVDNGRFEYSSASVNRYLAQRRNLLRPRFWRMTSDLLRFYRNPSALLEAGETGDLTLGEYLDREGYSDAFVEHHILPMSAAIWSTTPDEIRSYPLLSFARFYSSHGLLSIGGRPQWRTVSGGSRKYVARLLADMKGARIAGAARSIERFPGGVIIEDHRGRLERYTDIVIATHADEALSLLRDPDDHERRLLGAFGYTQNHAVLHSDPSLMPRNRRVWSSWNFIGRTDAAQSDQLTVTYWMNRLQNIDRRTPLFVTLNPHRDPRPGTVHGHFSYSHPFFDHAAIRAQDELWRLQGRRQTWFCGAHFGYGFHEDGLQSGLAVAEALGGVRRPWLAAPDRIARAVPAEETEIAA